LAALNDPRIFFVKSSSLAFGHAQCVCNIENGSALAYEPGGMGLCATGHFAEFFTHLDFSA
jgi:hypothetical protein